MNMGKRIDAFEREVHSTTADFADCMNYHMQKYSKEAREKYFLQSVLSQFHAYLRQYWIAVMHDGAFAGVSLIDNVGNTSEMVGGAKGTVYNIAGFMMNMIKKANVKDKSRVKEQFILHNKVSMAEANDDSRLVTCVVDDREYKTGALV
jgi:hypothetical protein